MSATDIASADGTAEVSRGTSAGDAGARGETTAETDETGAERSDRGTDATPESGADAPIPKDVVFDILKNERRRRALHYLREHPTTTLSDLAEHVAALENDKPVRDLTSSERKRVYVGLYQCHLPKMDDAGVVGYDRSRGTIELRGVSSQCFVYLDVDRTDGADDEARAGRLSRWLGSLAATVGR